MENQGQHTGNTLIRIGDTHQEHTSGEMDKSRRRRQKREDNREKKHREGGKATRDLKCLTQRG